MEAEPNRIRLLLADDHPAMLKQIVGLLEQTFDVVGAVGNGLAVIEAAARLDPDVIVLDITMPGLDGIETARRLRSATARAKVIFLTVHEDRDYASAAFEAGGAGYVVKSRLATDLLPAIAGVLAGTSFVSPSVPHGNGS